MLTTKNRIKHGFRKLLTVGLAIIILAGSFHNGAGVLEVFATTDSVSVEIVPTIRMGDNPPMIRDEFLEWASQRGLRHFNIDGSIFPTGIFFGFSNGKSFSYGALDGAILSIVWV